MKKTRFKPRYCFPPGLSQRVRGPRLRCIFCWVLALLLSGYSGGAARAPFGAGLNARQTPGDVAPQLELQLNAEFWQLLSWNELKSLAELRRSAGADQWVIPLQYLYPQLLHTESIDSRNVQGELLEVEARDLKNSYLQLGRDGALTLVLLGEIQENPRQLNIYGEPYYGSGTRWQGKEPPTLRLWIEEGLESFGQISFLTGLETYQRFAHLRIEVQLVRDMTKTMVQVLRDNNAAQHLPDVILADRRAISMLSDQLAILPGGESSAPSSLAFQELFERSGTPEAGFYASPFALEPYSLIYNTELWQPSASRVGHTSGMGLSELFRDLETLRARDEGSAASPYFLGLDDEGLLFSLLLSSFVQPDDFREMGPKIPGLYAGVQYLREQRQKGLLRQLDHGAERFAQGDVAAIISRAGNIRSITHLAKSKYGNHSGEEPHIRLAPLPYNDLSNNRISQYARVWAVGILQTSKLKAQAQGLRRYLLQGRVQEQFDLTAGLLPGNTAYYSFYEKSPYYSLLIPPHQSGTAVYTEDTWDIDQRFEFQQTEEISHLFGERSNVLLDSDIALSFLLTDAQQQWQREIRPGHQFLFLR